VGGVLDGVLRTLRSCEGRCPMIKWNYRATRVALVLSAIAAYAVASGAAVKWGA